MRGFDLGDTLQGQKKTVAGLVKPLNGWKKIGINQQIGTHFHHLYDV